MAKDADYDKVSLLLHFDELNGFADSSPVTKTITASGAQVSTAQSKFGGASARFNLGDYFTVPESTAFGFGTGDFTIELWVRPALTGGDGTQVFIDFRPVDAGIPLLIGCTSAGAVRWYDGLTVRTAGSMTADTWHHVAWCRKANVNTIYLDGVSVSTYTATQDFGASKGLCFGVNVIKGAERYVGYHDEVRITKGLSRYDGDFTPDAAAFPQLGDLSGTVLDADGDPAARLVRAMREDTGAFAGQTTSDPTTGAYFLSVNSEGAHTLLNYPAGGEDLPALVLRGVVPV